MMNFNRPVTPNPANGPPVFGLRIKTPPKLVVISYDDMKNTLVEEGNLNYDSILVDDKARSVCIYEKDGMKFVLKLGSHDARDDTTKFKLLRNEDRIYTAIQSLPQAQQKYFPKVYDAGSVEEKFYYIIMEFVNGITLYDYINQAHMSRILRPKKEVLGILLNLTKALNALYSLGFMHGDLSVENVMIEPDYNVKLIDFEKTSADIKLEANTYGTTGIDIDDKMTEGVGFFFLIVKTLEVAENKQQFAGLLDNLKKKIDGCTLDKCRNFYDECEKLLRDASAGGRRKSRRGVLRRQRFTRKRS